MRKKRSVPQLILLVLVIVAGLCVVPIGIDRGIQAIALRPMAARLGVSPTKTALTAYVAAILESHKGASSAEIHQVLDPIGGFEYTELVKEGEGRVAESAYWTMATLPLLKWKIWAVWILHYDADWRLERVGRGSD